MVFNFDSSYLYGSIIRGLSQIHKNVTYIISGENLFVSAAFINRIIDVKTIRKIEKSNNFIATGTDRATAPSNKALEILYNKYETIKVSPENESDFIKDLLEINPNIKVII
ncbi:PH domain-containing protein [Capnocytophaga stomatis]|uniref:PH domain-containing protein n=1 Tax=Capnocytophaga stomatis TaxID=1848904 RepID=A0ABW8Q8R1_9FLAO